MKVFKSERKSAEWLGGNTDVIITNQCDKIWQTFKSLRQFLKALFSVWQNFEPSLTIFYAIRQIYIVVNWQALKNNLANWSHCL